MPSNTKYVASYINQAAAEIIKIRAAVLALKQLRTKFVNKAVVTAGTPIEGYEAPLSASITNLGDESDKALWTAIINEVVPTHKGGALDG